MRTLRAEKTLTDKWLFHGKLGEAEKNICRVKSKANKRFGQRVKLQGWSLKPFLPENPKSFVEYGNFFSPGKLTLRAQEIGKKLIKMKTMWTFAQTLNQTVPTFSRNSREDVVSLTMQYRTLRCWICVWTGFKCCGKSFSCGISGSWLTRLWGESHELSLPGTWKRRSLCAKCQICSK